MKKILLAVTLIISTIIIADRLLFRFTSFLIHDVYTKNESHNNASGNFYNSYKVYCRDLKTGEPYELYINQETAALASSGDVIDIGRSDIFDEPNYYYLHKEGVYKMQASRKISGTWIPVIMILVGLASFRFGQRISTLVFVMEVVLIADLIYLLL